MKCYLCQSSDYFQRSGKVRDNPDIRIMQCSNCGLVFLDKQCIDDVYYEKNNMLSSDFFRLTQRDDDSLQNQILFLEKEWGLRAKKRIEFLQESLIGKNILDFGSGHAQFLLLAKKYAKTVSGVELESQIENIYKENDITLYRSLSEINEINVKSKDIMLGGGMIL